MRRTTRWIREGSIANERASETGKFGLTIRKNVAGTWSSIAGFQFFGGKR